MKTMISKRLKWLALAACLALPVAARPQTDLAQANRLAIDGSYAEAIEKYESILADGSENATLYYNLGYAYYKTGHLSKAIVNLERAKILNPNDEDIQYNLEVAYSQTVDKIDELRPVFFVRWISAAEHLFSSDTWAVAFLAALFLFFACFFAFLFAKRLVYRKIGFFAGLFMMLVSCLSFAFSATLRSERIDRDAAIIFAPSVTLTTSPDDNGTELVVLHEGTKVRILSRIGEWCEVRLADGNVGWIKDSYIEII